MILENLSHTTKGGASRKIKKTLLANITNTSYIINKKRQLIYHCTSKNQ